MPKKVEQQQDVLDNLHEKLTDLKSAHADVMREANSLYLEIKNVQDCIEIVKQVINLNPKS